MSLWSYRLDQNTNEKFDNFCPERARAEIIKNFVGILVQTITPKGHFEINWPLDEGLIYQTWDSKSVFTLGQARKRGATLVIRELIEGGQNCHAALMEEECHSP